MVLRNIGLLVVDDSETFARRCGLCLQTIRKIKALPAAPKAIAMTLGDSSETEASAYAAGADDFVAKQDFGEKLHATMNMLIEGRRS